MNDLFFEWEVSVVGRATTRTHTTLKERPRLERSTVATGDAQAVLQYCSQR